MTHIHVLLDMAKRLAPVRYLEIGVQEGYSFAAVLALDVVVSGVGVDNWGIFYGGTGRGSGSHVLERLGPLAAKAKLYTGDSRLILPTLTDEFDLIFVDGDHSVEGALADLDQALAHLAPGGLIAADDLDHPQHRCLRPAILGWAQRKRMRCVLYPVEHTVAELRR